MTIWSSFVYNDMNVNLSYEEWDRYKQKVKMFDIFP